VHALQIIFGSYGSYDQRVAGRQDDILLQ
jgi:hypothetical protein